MSASSSVVSFGPSSTLSMIQSMVKSWQSESQDQVDQDIATLKSTASSLSPGYIGIAQASNGKLNAAIIKAGLQQGGSDDEWAKDYVEGQTNEFTRENSLSSEDISNTLYSGGSIRDEYAATLNEDVSFSFASLLQGFITGSDPDTATYKQLSQAIATHSLTVQKATDVQGLDYHLNEMWSASGGSSSGGWDESYNSSVTGMSVNQDTERYEFNVAADGKHHYVLNATGDLGLYFSW